MTETSWQQPNLTETSRNKLKLAETSCQDPELDCESLRRLKAKTAKLTTPSAEEPKIQGTQWVLGTGKTLLRKKQESNRIACPWAGALKDKI